MITLVMMYVYFDSNGDIKAISPDPMNTTEADTYLSSTFPLSEVEGFLTGKKNPADYHVKLIKDVAGSTYRLVKKCQVDVSAIRSLDTFLTEVSTNIEDRLTVLFIENITEDKEIKIYINERLKNVIIDSDDIKNDIDSLLSRSAVYLFFTRFKDPYSLIHTMAFNPKELLTRDIVLEYDIDLSGTSVYTKKILSGYKYIER